MQRNLTLIDLARRVRLITPGLLTRKPRLLARALLRQVSQAHRHTPALLGVEFAPHYLCNFHCSHCYEQLFHTDNRHPLTLGEQKEIIAQCLHHGVLNFTFVGGESLLYPHLEELICSCKPAQTYISLATNGWALTERKIIALRDLGVDKINLSIDSWDAREHDTNRGRPGSHERILSAIQMCKKNRMVVSLSIVVSNGSTQTDGFLRTVDFCQRNKVRLQFKMAVPMGAWQGQFDKMITSQERHVLSALNKQNNLLTSCSFGGCNAMRQVITISAYGDVMPCNSIHVSFGNLRTTPLADIMTRGQSIPFFQGKKAVCLCAEDEDFIHNYLTRTYNTSPYPPDYTVVFDRKDSAANGQ